MRKYPAGIVFIVALWTTLIACGTSTQNSTMPIPDAPSSRRAPTGSLPQTADIDFHGLRLLEVVFRTQLNINRIDDLYGTTRRQVQNLSVVANCDLVVLKAIVAKGWPPLVLLQYGNNRHLWAVVGYDDASQQIYMENPISRIVRTVSYTDFEKEWTSGSAGKFVLITAGKLNEAKVHLVLRQFLPADQAAEVTVRSR